MAVERTVPTREVDARWLFNNLHVGVLLIDARPRDAASASTVVNAINIPPSLIGEPASMLEVENLCFLPAALARFDRTKRRLRDVVLIGDSDATNTAWRHCLQRLLVAERLVSSVAMMQDSVAEFQTRYPFYTVPSNTLAHAPSLVGAGFRVTYPNEIVDDFLYLGNMWQAECAQVMADLGITHIVNATLDLGNALSSMGIHYHEVKVRDDPDVDISAFFDNTFAFIDQARRDRDGQEKEEKEDGEEDTTAIPTNTDATMDSHPLDGRRPRARVFVHCTQGISRSATLVLMYLMRTERWSLVTAFNFVRRGRPIILPNNGFFRALLHEEQRLFNGLCSLREQDIGALLQGSIPDREANLLVMPLPMGTNAASTITSPAQCALQ